MKDNQQEKKFLRKLRFKYRLSVYREETYQEVLNFRLSRMNVLAWGGITLLFFTGLVVAIIAYTPVKEFIPGYPDENTRKELIHKMQLLDSIEAQILKRELYLNNTITILQGKQPNNYDNIEDTNKNYDGISFSRSEEDSLLREYFKEQELFSVEQTKDPILEEELSEILLFPPAKGIVTNSFNPSKNHFGTDIVAKNHEIVKCVLEGTVTMRTWTLETGWIIQVQHKNNLISIYKHNSEILKKMGDHVDAGEPIAIIGNSGELTTGPHLHFELWHKGVPIDPEEYISF